MASQQPKTNPTAKVSKKFAQPKSVRTTSGNLRKKQVKVAQLTGQQHRKQTAEPQGRGRRLYTPGQMKRTTTTRSMGEEAPPTAKHERMVKAIKKGYAKDGLTKKEKSIAYATAWKDFNEHRSSPDNRYPIYKTKEYENRPSRAERQAAYKQKIANKKTARKIMSAKITKKAEKTTPTMSSVKDSMWGKGKHSTMKPSMWREGTFTQQFDPEYTEAKQRVKNTIRKKLGLKPGPQGDWKKELKNKHGREILRGKFKEEVKFPKDYDPPKSWSKPPSEKELNKMAKYYAKQDKKKLKETKLPPHLAKFIDPKTGNLKAKYEKRISKPKFTVKDVTPKGYGPGDAGAPVTEDMASGRPIKKPVKKIGTGKWIGRNLKKYPKPAWALGQKDLAAGDIAINQKLGIKLLWETAEYDPTPGGHEWGTPQGTDYFKKLTPGQSNPKEDPVKPLDIKARKPEDEKAAKITEKVGDKCSTCGCIIKENGKCDCNITEDTGFNLDQITSKQAEYSKERYPEDNEDDAKWKSNLDGILTGAYEGGEITWADVKALDKEAENITFDQEIKMGLYEPEELMNDDFDNTPWGENEINVTEVLSVQGRMKRRFAARRNRQKLKVARGIALRRGSTPDRLKRRATRGARLLVYKRLLRGRDRAQLPPAEKMRLERMIKRYAPLVSRVAVKMLPQMRKNEINRMKNRSGRVAKVSRKYKPAKPIRSASQRASKKFRVPKPGKYKPPKAKKFKSRIGTGGPTIKKQSTAYKAFTFSVG